MGRAGRRTVAVAVLLRVDELVVDLDLEEARDLRGGGPLSLQCPGTELLLL